MIRNRTRNRTRKKTKNRTKNRTRNRTKNRTRNRTRNITRNRTRNRTRYSTRNRTRNSIRNRTRNRIKTGQGTVKFTGLDTRQRTVQGKEGTNKENLIVLYNEISSIVKLDQSPKVCFQQKYLSNILLFQSVSKVRFNSYSTQPIYLQTDILHIKYKQRASINKGTHSAHLFQPT